MKVSTNCAFVVVFGDLHAGSTIAPCPEKIELPDGMVLHRSKVQTWLTDCWTHFCQQFVPTIVGKRPFVVVNMGDSIEGDHHGGNQTVTRDSESQRAIALGLISLLVRRPNCHRYYGIAGTECHTRGHEEVLNHQLGAPRCSITRRYAPDYLDLKVGDCLTSFRHHIPTSTRRGALGSQLSVQLMEEQGVAAGAKDDIPRVVVRAHRHAPGTYTDHDGLSLVTPPWQLFTRHTHKVAAPAWRGAKVGGYVLDYTKVEGEFDLPMVHAKIYRPKG